ncbi:MAG: TcpQ domain-containing protein [Pusillimonas sp.]|nr:TcpQ domain-containing protein [Pusillimonas sp.]
MMRHFSRWTWAAVACAVLASGCANLPDWSLFGPLHGGAKPAAMSSYDFSWRLSGDRRAGPLQVFDDGRSTWLQFMPDQALPAIFARSGQGDELLDYRRQGPYVVLDGVWPLLVLKAGLLESRVERIAAQDPDQGSGMGATLADPVEMSASAGGAADELQLAIPLPVSTPPAGAAGTAAPEPFFAAPVFQVSPQDGNLRLALGRWAASSGWTFEAEHWAVDVDVPIVGSAAFDLEFDQAVQQLLASTELSDRPLQPCFYANKVLRVVPYAQSCDRTAAPERA